MMKAAVLYGAKDIRLEEYITPNLRSGMVLLQVRRVGICGSDLHYFDYGYCGAFVPSNPFILGHELTAEVVAVADDVLKPAVGARVTVNPARACGFCTYCKKGLSNLCPHTIMLGSGSTTPATDGAMAEFVVVRHDQCHLLPENISDGSGAMIEPFAVALQAVKRAGNVAGKRVLVTGGGTIGLLTALAAKNFGAVPVVVSDIVSERRAAALGVGIDEVLNPLDPDFVEQAKTVAGDGFDCVFEASGSPVALRQAFDLVRPRGTIVQIGTLGAQDIPLPANEVMVKEIEFLGSFRYANLFDEAITLVQAGRINLEQFITAVYPLADINSAMYAAGDKIHALKVQIEI